MSVDSVVRTYEPYFNEWFSLHKESTYHLVGITVMDDGYYFTMRKVPTDEISFHCVLGGLEGAGFELVCKPERIISTEEE